ncbi:MAG TPA: hypothetical protein VEV19_10395, partial [Ktedonobacteraceae bacterium]|nr:hypothetical protein [Ktedonobacteraceae bacterium]
MRVENSPKITERKRDITSWQEGDISRLSNRAKKRYQSRKSAIQDYFTTDMPSNEIARKYHLATDILLELVEKCLRHSEDGTLWGFRALLPGVNVIDHAAPSVVENTDDVATSNAIQQEDQPAEQNSTISSLNGHNGHNEHNGYSSGGQEQSSSSVLVEDQQNNEDVEDEEEDTAKREALKMARLAELSEITDLSDEMSEVLPHFTLSVPETPLPAVMSVQDATMENAGVSQDNESELASDEENEQTERLQPLSQSELASDEEEERTGRLQP